MLFAFDDDEEDALRKAALEERVEGEVESVKTPVFCIFFVFFGIVLAVVAVLDGDQR